MNANLVLVVAALTIAGCTHDKPAPTSNAPTGASPALADAGSAFAPDASANEAPRVPDAGGKATMDTNERRTLAQAAFDKVAPKTKPGEDPTKSLGWGMALTPVFPAAWPPDGRVVAYVFARGHRMSLMDGEHVAAPFARIVSAASAPDRIETLGSTLRELGIQGVRPLRKDELATPDVMQLEADVRALRSPPGAAPESLRASYCQWKKLNGVIAAGVIGLRDPAPAAFFRWLGCADGGP